MNSTALEILRAALEEIRDHMRKYSYGSLTIETMCTAALEAAAKAPGLADDEALRRVVGRLCRDADWPMHQPEDEYVDYAGRLVLRAIDAYQRGGAKP